MSITQFKKELPVLSILCFWVGLGAGALWLCCRTEPGLVPVMALQTMGGSKGAS